ncbi:hypothetical protein [Pedobacter nutrimenti]|uniref:hypothetical protein n=1 Tax=Pedobacter nutrimenti TaxID=1241337 RepID=UPI00292FE645|nr:hypothetical protein [Pedobacter nutrimenti]
MLEGITWKAYLLVVGIAIVIYYIIIGCLYYRGEIKKLIKGRGADDFGAAAYEEESVSSFDELEEIVEDIKHGILEKAGKEANKEDLIRQISERVAGYDGLRQPAYRIALTNFIKQQSEDICGVTISEGELEAVWKRLPR